MTSYAIDAEIELLRRLHRGARAQLAALAELPERSPENDLRLRALVRLERRLSDRIEAMSRTDNARGRQTPPLRPLAPSSTRAPLAMLPGMECAAGAPESS
jgi:hypothetical protein